jgi:hypothetical protein
MRSALSHLSIDHAGAKSDLFVVLLEGIHESAIDALRHDGFNRLLRPLRDPTHV